MQLLSGHCRGETGVQIWPALEGRQKKKKKKDVKCLDKDGGYATKYPTFEWKT